ncbi:MAG: cupin domain-containing protein [Candidatus Aureabacteria bacterium]|nr:cupin domain-containing protein [Candidatus Auribacterota bacterium]
MNHSRYWIEKLNLQPHPEGGYFREVYRSGETIPKVCLPERFSGDRVFSTSIYFLLERDQFSAFHRIKQDELWHFYDGASLTIHIIDPDGSYHAEKLGRNPDEGEVPFAVVKAGAFFAAEVNDKTSFTLAGCTVAPGFEFADFEMPEGKVLLEQFPKYEEIIRKFSK